METRSSAGAPQLKGGRTATRDYHKGLGDKLRVAVSLLAVPLQLEPGVQLFGDLQLGDTRLVVQRMEATSIFRDRQRVRPASDAGRDRQRFPSESRSGWSRSRAAHQLFDTGGVSFEGAAAIAMSTTTELLQGPVD